LLFDNLCVVGGKKTPTLPILKIKEELANIGMKYEFANPM
jgi:hypothetical protein